MVSHWTLDGQPTGAHHDREDTLLHLSSVLSAKDNHLHTLEVNLDGGGGGHAGGETVGRELAGIVNDEVWFTEGLELGFGRSDEHVVHEKGVVGSCADDPNFDAELGIPLRSTKVSNAGRRA